ncbi:MAG: 3'-5' exonuclease, partial [Cyanobacteria bacterium J06638_20]
GALDQGTLSFWLGQGDKARSMLVQGLQNDGVPLLDALTSLMTWPAETGIPGFESWADVDGLWSNGAAFDIPILENAFNMCGLPAPWHYRSARCCRTVTALKGDVTVDTTGMVEHYAPDDCLCQVMKLQKQLFP